MPETIELLLCNVPDPYVSTVLDIFCEGNITAEVTCANGKEEVLQSLMSKSWDAVLVSEQYSESGFPMLNWINSKSKFIPVILITAENVNKVTGPALWDGANDCISKDHLIRLLPVIKREINHSRLRKDYEKTLTQKNNLLKKQLELSERDKQETNFLANAIHDMSTSLNSIVISGKLLLRDSNDNFSKDQKKIVQAIHHSGNYLLRYINNFLNSPHKESPGTSDTSPGNQTVDTHTFCRNIYRVFVPVAQKNNLSFEYEISGEVPSGLNGNPLYIERILTNLLSNAFKYTPTGNITFTVFSPAKDELNQTSLDSNHLVAFQIKDTGIGIPEEEQKHIFKRHHRTHQKAAQSRKGTGLGLNICQQLADLLGGEIQFKSQLGRGSTFTLVIPASTPSDTKKSEAIKEGSNKTSGLKMNPPKNETVLVIDDSRIHNMAVKEFLSYAVATCITACSAAEAYQILSNNTIDCIILDLTLPDANGLQVAKHIRSKSEYAHIPIILYTGKELSQRERNMLNKYVDTILKKEAKSYNKLISNVTRLSSPT